MTEEFIIIGISILPVLVLAIYIYRKDSKYPEPFNLLFKLFILGGFGSVLCALFLGSGISSFHISYNSPLLNALFTAFITAGLVEEFSKFIMTKWISWNHKDFDEHFDGIVYCSMVSLGFACIENIMYVASGENLASSISIGFTRCIFSVPGHFLFGVIMGYYFSLAKFIPEKKNHYLIKAVIFPTLGHGCFDTLLMVNIDNDTFTSFVLFCCFIWFDIKLWKIGKKRIQQLILIDKENNF